MTDVDVGDERSRGRREPKGDRHQGIPDFRGEMIPLSSRVNLDREGV